METKQAKVVASVLALVVLQVFSLSSLAQDEPRKPISDPCTISSSGSYYLTRNITTTSGSQNAITVNADNVTIDLMGYSLIGTGSGTGCGIFMNARKNVEIRNGTVRNFGGDGIREAKSPTEADPSFGSAHRVIGVRAHSNKGDGIALNGIGHLVKDCTSEFNAGDGIFTDAGSIVSGNVTFLNAAHGINLGGGCFVSGNTSAANQINGIWTAFGCAVMNNNLYNNGCGIYVSGNGSYVKLNTLRSNVFYNIYVRDADNAIEENLVTNSEYGIYFRVSGSFYANNRASGNTTDYGGPGKPASGSPADGGGNVSF